MAASSDDARKAYEEFKEKVGRTVFLDNLSPQVTVAVIEHALGQFGSVKHVEFIPNYTVPFSTPQSALVEMENKKQARAVVSEMRGFPFMMSGMPRPVRAKMAEIEMFADHPAPPGRNIQVRWINPSDPNFQIAKQVKELYKKHKTEHLALIKHQLTEEEALAKQQQAMLRSNYKKYEMVESSMHDGSTARIGRYYNISLDDD